MKVFICSYSSFSIAIPMEFVSSIYLYQDNQQEKIQYDAENRNTYISLPVLLGSPASKTHHGIILKGKDDADYSSNCVENKTILLSTEIESENEFPDEIFYPIPKALAIFQFSMIFNGIYLKKDAGKLILLLNPEQLVQNIQKELIL
jgi:hypothetical protein